MEQEMRGDKEGVGGEMITTLIDITDGKMGRKGIV